MDITSRNYLLFPCLVGLLSFLGALAIDIALLRLPFLTFAGTSFLYVIHRGLPKQSVSPLSPETAKLFDSLLFLVITATVLAGQWGPAGVMDYYYPVAIGAAALLAYRLTRPPVHTAMTLGQILLFSLGLRATLWFSYPAYGADRFHLAATGWITEVHELVPADITYYHYFPTAHVLAGVNTLLTGLPTRTGYFVLGIVQALSIVGVFIFARHILSSNRGGLFASLFVAVSGYHIKSGGEPFAQALLTAIFPIIFFLLFHRNLRLDARHLGILLGLAAFGSITQNIAPLILIGVSSVLWVSAKILNHLKSVVAQGPTFSIRAAVIVIVGIIGINWYIIVDYLSFQVYRVVALIFLLDGTGQSTIENTNVTGVPVVELFGHALPGVLMWAAPLLAAALTIGLVCYIVLHDVVAGTLDNTPIQYVGIAAGIFSIVGLVFAAGSESAVRAMPIVAILVAPLAGYLGVQTSGTQGAAQTGVVVIVIAIVAVAGVLTPPVAKAEWSEDSNQRYNEASQVEGAMWALEYTESAFTDPYTANTAHYRQAMAGDMPVDRVQPGFDAHNITTIHQFQNRIDEGETVLYLSYYEDAFGLEPPNTNQVYDSGDTVIYTGNESDTPN